MKNPKPLLVHGWWNSKAEEKELALLAPTGPRVNVEYHSVALADVPTRYNETSCVIGSRLEDKCTSITATQITCPSLSVAELNRVCRKWYMQKYLCW